ncbi:MAG: YlxR family protein [Acidimicrobiales bacterium]
MAPIRTCVGCRRRALQTALVRVTRSGDELVPGPGMGRGAWLCRDSAACLERAVAQPAFDRAFGVAITATALEALGRRLTAAGAAPGRAAAR